MLGGIFLLLFFVMNSCGGMSSYEDYDAQTVSNGKAPADIQVGGSYNYNGIEAQETAKEQTLREMDERFDRVYDLRDIN